MRIQDIVPGILGALVLTSSSFAKLHPGDLTRVGAQVVEGGHDVIGLCLLDSRGLDLVVGHVHI